MDPITIEIIKILLVLAVVYVAVTLGEYIAWVEYFSKRRRAK